MDQERQIEGMFLVGWVIVDTQGLPIRRETRKNWYDEKPTPSPAKLYKTKKIAERYGTACPVYIILDSSDNS